MARGFEAVKTLTIDAPPAKVWEALTNPAQVKQYMHGTTLSTDWKVGGPISWTGEWNGQAYEDKGEVLEFEARRRLKNTHWSSMGGSEDIPENYHTVTYELVDLGDKTRLTLTQDNNPSQEAADQMADANWGPILQGLKETAEK